MSINLKFERYKVQREIKRSGTYHTFYRPKKNDFGEPGELEPILTLRCLYHEYAPHTLDTYIYLTGSEGGTVVNKKWPQLLVLFEDIYFADTESSEKYSHIKQNDVVYFGERPYFVSGMRNYQELNIAYDISFVGVDDGENSRPSL